MISQGFSGSVATVSLGSSNKSILWWKIIWMLWQLTSQQASKTDFKWGKDKWKTTTCIGPFNFRKQLRQELGRKWDYISRHDLK